MESSVCPHCRVLEGQIHHYGCDSERCPFCGNQLETCGCCFIKLGFDYKPIEWDGKKCVQVHPTNGLPEEIFENGLTDDLKEEWHRILNKKGRVPYILYPTVCMKCGMLWPEMFRVPDEEWEKYVMIRERKGLLCKPCYDQIKKWIDEKNK